MTTNVLAWDLVDVKLSTTVPVTVSGKLNESPEMLASINLEPDIGSWGVATDE